MKLHITMAFAFALASCGQQSEPRPDVAQPAASDELVLTCADFAPLTPVTIVERFGAENVTSQTLPRAEGESYEATLVYASDPTRRLELTWNEDHSALATVTVGGATTQWHGAEGYTIGTPIADIERINVMPFKLWGFDWDYGGWVSDWKVGTFTLQPGCTTRIRFEPRNNSNTSASGDSEFDSNSPAMRDADPVVASFGLMFSTPTSE